MSQAVAISTKRSGRSAKPLGCQWSLLNCNRGDRRRISKGNPECHCVDIEQRPLQFSGPEKSM